MQTFYHTCVFATFILLHNIKKYLNIALHNSNFEIYSGIKNEKL